MRILMVTNTYAPARNGVAMWVALSVREMRAMGHEVDVLTFSHDRRPPGVPGVIETPSWAGIDPDFRVAPVFRRLPAGLAGRTYDVVHVHHPILLGPVGVRFARACGARVAFTCHSVYTDYLDEYYGGAGRFLKPWLEGAMARLANSCDVVFAPSERVGEWLARIGVTVPRVRLDAPADTERLPPMPRDDARRALGIGERPLALYVGRIADEKRVADLVREFAPVPGRVPGAMLVLVGTGRREATVRRLIGRLGLSGAVRMTGPLDAADLRPWYAAADAFVSASPAEVGPLTVVEAMAFGCPTVALRAPGFTDRVADGVNGLLAGRAPGELGDAIERVIGGPALRARLSAGATSAAPAYSPRAVTEAIVEVYRSLIEA